MQKTDSLVVITQREHWSSILNLCTDVPLRMQYEVDFWPGQARGDLQIFGRVTWVNEQGGGKLLERKVALLGEEFRLSRCDSLDLRPCQSGNAPPTVDVALVFAFPSRSTLAKDTAYLDQTIQLARIVVEYAKAQ